MVQPVRLVLGFSVLVSVAGVATPARAEPVPTACRTGLVLGVSDEDARDVVTAVCGAARKRLTAGVVRVSVLAAGTRVRVGVARLVDTQESEQTAHAEAANVAEAIRIAPAILEALEATSTRAPAPPPPPTPHPPPFPAAEAVPSSSPPPPRPSPETPERIPVAKEEPAKEQPASALETKAGPPAAWVGVHGSSALAGGGAGFGGGGAIGVDHRSAQGFLDYSNSSGSPSSDEMRHSLLTIGARLKLSQAALKPVIGGGWSYIDYDRSHGTSRTRGEGIGVFAEAGVIYAIEHHQILALARWNLGLYEERATSPYSYTGYDGTRYDTQSTRTGDGLSSSFAFLAGYGYVFR